MSLQNSIIRSEGSEERRILVYLVLDVSGSMQGPGIAAVQEGLELIEKELKKIPEAITRAHLCVITFDSSAHIAAALTPVGSFKAPRVSASGSTDMAGALQLLHRQIDNDFRVSAIGGQGVKGDYKPLVFLMTDGAPDNLQTAVQAAQQIHNRKTVGLFVALGCGGANEANLKQITPTVAMMPNMNSENIRQFFVWISQSIRNTSVQVERGEGSAPLPEAPKDASGNSSFVFTFE